MKDMKKSIFFTILVLATCLWTGCKEDDELPAMSRTALKSYGPDFCEIQSRLYLTGSSSIIRSGACWVLKSTKEYDPNALEFATTDDNVQEFEINEPDVYRMRIEGLQSDTVFYVRFFATNGEGTFYSYPVRVHTSKVYDDKVFVETGKFMMGSAAGQIDEMPIHEVEFEHNFYISKNEITNAEYCDFMNERGVETDGTVNGEEWINMKDPASQIIHDGNEFVVKNGADQLPVVCVTWFGAQAFCEASGGNLPTEAEWEFAANSGLKKMGTSYSGSATASDVAWFNETNLHKGGMKKANALGIFDMSGNVSEWCSDWYSSKAYEESLLKDPQGPKSGTKKVVRGGSYNQDPITITKRDSQAPTSASPYVGFRVVNKI